MEKPEETYLAGEMLPLMLSDGLNDLPGVSCLAPDGAFYVFPNVKGTGISSRELADYFAL